MPYLRVFVCVFLVWVLLGRFNQVTTTIFGDSDGNSEDK